MMLRHHLHDVSHVCNRVVDGNHSWVVLMEMMAQCLFGSLSLDNMIIRRFTLFYFTYLVYTLNMDASTVPSYQS